MENTNTVATVVDYIENNLNDKLPLDKIAERVGYSKFHINRLFSEITGCTIHKYIQMRRLTEAAKKLVYTEKPIIEIAFEANYDSQQSFTLAFRQLYNCTPQQYRMKRIYTPKQNRLTINNSITMRYKFKLNCEVMAA